MSEEAPEYGPEDAVADDQDHLAEQSDNSGEIEAILDDAPQGENDVVDDDADDDDEEEGEDGE